MSEIVSVSPPSSGDTFTVRDHVGKLLIVKPHAFETGITTVNGQADAIRADVYVLTGPGTADEYADTLLWGKYLVSQLRNEVGKTLVGRVGQGAAQPGKSAPWVLEGATDEDIEKAKAYLDKSPAVTTAAPPF